MRPHNTSGELVEAPDDDQVSDLQWCLASMTLRLCHQLGALCLDYPPGLLHVLLSRSLGSDGKPNAEGALFVGCRVSRQHGLRQDEVCSCGERLIQAFVELIELGLGERATARIQAEDEER